MELAEYQVHPTPRQLAAELFLEVKRMTADAVAAYKAADKAVKAEIARGIPRTFGRPKLRLEPGALELHMETVDLRRGLHHELAYLRPLLRRLQGSLQRGDSFADQTVRRELLVLRVAACNTPAAAVIARDLIRKYPKLLGAAAHHAGVRLQPPSAEAQEVTARQALYKKIVRGVALGSADDARLRRALLGADAMQVTPVDASR